MRIIFTALFLSLLAGIGCEHSTTPVAGLTTKSPTTVGSTARPDISINERGSAAVGPDAAAGNPDAGQPSQRTPKANTPDETAAQATRMTPTKPVIRQANKRIDAISNNLMTRQVNQRATQIQNAGLIESNQRLAAYKSTAFHSEIVKLMTYAAAHTLMKRRDHWRVVQAPEWKLLLKRVRRDLSQYRTKSKRANVRLNDIMMAVLHMLDKDDPYERASAYALVDHIFSALGERLPQGFEAPFIRSIAARMSLATSVPERTMLVESALKHDRDGNLFAFAISVILGNKDWAVRKKALEGLERCAIRYKKCNLAPVMLDLIYTRHEDARTRGPLILYAAALKYPAVTKWCTPHLSNSPLMLPCRAALGRLQTEKAFDLLYAWLDQRKDEPSSKRPQNYSFRDEFKSIMPFANKRFARYKLPKLLYTVLGQDLRDGFATGGIVRMMDQMEDAKRALQILKATKAFYKAKFADRVLHRSQQFLMDELDAMIKRMKPRAVKQDRHEQKEMIRPRQ